MSHRVYLVEDHPVLRQALTHLINASDDFEVVGSAESAEAALKDLPTLDAELAVVDVSLAGSGERTHGIYLTEQLRRLWPRLRVLVVSGHDETVYAEPALAAGARGYLMKHEAASGLIPALTRVLFGEVVLSARMQQALPEALRAPMPAL